MSSRKCGPLIRLGSLAGPRGIAVAPDGTPLRAWAAYVLAFHRAQDAADAARMLLAAERLRGPGEPGLARHLQAEAGEAAAWAASVEDRSPAGRR